MALNGACPGCPLRDYPARLEPDPAPGEHPRRGLSAGTPWHEWLPPIALGRGTATDPEALRTTVIPRLKEVELGRLVEATGLTKSACSRIAQGWW